MKCVVGSSEMRVIPERFGTPGFYRLIRDDGSADRHTLSSGNSGFFQLKHLHRT